ncbi:MULTISPECIES: response regulator transcription factor [Paenibacillus]|uniref:Response regulator transcription factor n=1 Tax=Paenibacillus alvei TaxID=44250 RepID=A0ABT4E9I5_PAEAL|nr:MULTISPECIES: response regulator transcription factor [Paenibacillus]EPY14648.1 two component transcriptional regulator, winged helix family protein [Paenibacillus alvei A6-6i-x]MCY9530413.1 response regulator transcription factor [Paenibacillus alvei]SDF72513.1 DNA-binding response regulator, OmpR family, contains REC and winged-helix (wHTH) domain [Paenibacillus sp. cl6col]
MNKLENTMEVKGAIRNHVLVVEDDHHIRRFISINLERNGFQVSEAAMGSEAMMQFTTNRPDAVILDIMLPDMEGFEICRQIRDVDSEVVIIFLTAKGQDFDKIKGLELGADDYIVKPFNPLELVARINTVLRRSNQSSLVSSRIIESGPITLDKDANKVCKHGMRIEMTPKEYGMIKAFLEHPDKALSRDELLNLAWGEDFVGDPKTVDVHVRKLREKIEDDSSNPRRIETVWGMGYRWKRGE